MCTKDSAAMAASATSALRDTTSEIRGSGTATSGVASPAAGTNRPRYSARATALAAIAPEKPATNDVHPVRNAGSRPNASRR